MGNSQSSDSPQSPSSSSAAAAGRRPRERDASQQRSKTRASAAPHHGATSNSATKKPAAINTGQTIQHQQHPPPSNLIPPSSLASISTSNAYAQATVSASPASAHSRTRSVTTSGVSSRPHSGDFASEPRDIVSPGGPGESKHRPPSRSATLPPPPIDIEKDPFRRSAEAIGHTGGGQHDETGLGYENRYGLGDHNDFSRPPRLPLPIETSHEPGSPIPSTLDIEAAPLEASDIDGMLGRRTSMLSSTTLDDDDAADIEAFVLDSDPGQPKVPTKIEYHGDAKGVYVTGTFVQWERKFRLHRNPQTGSFSTTFPLPTGTHHLKFLVDGDMRTSEELPTTVDFTNALVNYIEVVAPAPGTAGVSAPMAIPGTAASEGQSTGTVEGAVKPIDIRAETRTSEPAPASSSARAGGIGSSTAQQQIPDSVSGEAGRHEPHDQQQSLQKIVKQRLPRPKYTNTIPAFLLDLDLYQTPEDERYRRATKASEALPTPPSLPGFMGKSILNATTPHKDDASVLSMPNHTVLNHLATSSIKSGVLATSGTTRYKRKFLTTIMYKPTSDDG